MYLVSLPGTGHGHPGCHHTGRLQDPQAFCLDELSRPQCRGMDPVLLGWADWDLWDRILGRTELPTGGTPNLCRGSPGAFRGFRPDPEEKSQNVLVARVRPWPQEPRARAI